MSKILFVEDDALIARIYSQKLAEAGFDVAVAADGLEATRQLPKFKPDLVVLDLLMPRLTGADVLKFIRQHPDLESTRVIVFSNSFLSNLADQVAGMGVEAALVKAAVTPAQLVEAIHVALMKTKQDPQAAQPTAAPVAEAGKPGPKPLAGEKTEPAVRKESDTDFATRIGREFLERVPAVFQELRQLCREFLEAARSPREADCLAALNRKLDFLTQIAGMAGHGRTAELSSALEALLFELLNKTETITDSSRQTIAFTLAFLADCFDNRRYFDEKDRAPMNILVIDDDAVSNLAIVKSLGRAKMPGRQRDGSGGRSRTAET